MACTALCLGSSLNIVFSRFIHIVHDSSSFLITGRGFHLVTPLKFREFFSFFIMANNCTHLLVWKLHILGGLRRELRYRLLCIFNFRRHWKVFQSPSIHYTPTNHLRAFQLSQSAHWCCPSLHCHHSDRCGIVLGLWVYFEFPRGSWSWVTQFS